MGANIALDFAGHGFTVKLADVNAAQLEIARTTIETNAQLLTQHGLLDHETSRVSDIVFTADLPQVAAGASVVIEAVSENLAI